MRFCAVILTFLLLSGCDFLSSQSVVQSPKNRTVTCHMSGFRGFPRKITGPVVFELRTTVTIAVFNRARTERVDMTFPKSKCR